MANEARCHTLHQPRDGTITVRTRTTHITRAGIRQPWTAVSTLLGLISMT